MAKIRVYELARDLSMENKALLEKLAEMKVDVKSHMSSLDDEIIAQIKDFVLGKKKRAVKGTVVETRVKSTVIRRRVKLVTVKKVPQEPVSEAAEPAEVDEVAEHSVPAAPSVEPASTAETIAQPADIQPAKPPLPKTGKPTKATKKAKKEAPAKIIKLPTALPKKAPEPEKIPAEPAAPVVKDKIDKKTPAKMLKGEAAPLPIDEEELKGRPKKKGKLKPV